jgi:hypothetical protein
VVVGPITVTDRVVGRVAEVASGCVDACVVAWVDACVVAGTAGFAGCVEGTVCAPVKALAAAKVKMDSTRADRAKRRVIGDSLFRRLVGGPGTLNMSVPARWRYSASVR